MASPKDTATFFTEGSSNQFEYVLSLYPEALRLKAEKKVKKPEELIKLDNWYQNELPKKIKSRGKDAHLNHEELVQTMKWKQTRGKFYPQLSYLVKVNTPRAVMMETRKAFRKLPNLEQAIMALSNLKGVGTTMASALLAAAAPDKAPFMADECLKAIPDIDGIDYTTKEYLNFVQHISQTVNRLNGESGGNISFWNPHNVELALWTHYVASELKPELLDSIPNPVRNGKVAHQNGDVDASLLKNPAPVVDASSEDSNLDAANNGKSGAALVDENSTTSFTEDSLDKPLTPAPSTPTPASAPLTPAMPLAAEPDSTSNGAPNCAPNSAQGDETNDSIATSDSATNDSTVAVAASISQESVEGEGEGDESRSSVGEAKEARAEAQEARAEARGEAQGEAKEAEKRKQDDEETQVAKKAKTETEAETEADATTAVEPDTQQKEEQDK